MFLQSREMSALPPEVVRRAEAVGAETVSTTELADGKSAVTIDWPGATRVFLDEKAGARDS
ncbi:hypothetical protein Van01_41860 [Micromonospora andamanensis]|uniref:Uncharacterized protein n=2 Tax=Micromonospora andamanensis TaxID=1287068 RepID=A0ABQ4HZA5_9ACTN|nr:hypothetical protein Van01_41860 [Micromonospora andamanensis]GIJ41754.1 hypothetical protein Vwe01_50790 [Micromonospora andamanensis]